MRARWGSQSRLAERLGITPQAVQAVASGERSMPEAWLDDAAAVLGVDGSILAAARALDAIGVSVPEADLETVAAVIRAATQPQDQ